MDGFGGDAPHQFRRARHYVPEAREVEAPRGIPDATSGYECCQCKVRRLYNTVSSMDEMGDKVCNKCDTSNKIIHNEIQGAGK